MVQYHNPFANNVGFSAYDRANQEFEAKKRAQLLQEQLGAAQIQKLQKEIETGAATNDPAALRLANEYLAAKKAGDTERANALEAFAKTREKNVMLMPDGSYIPLGGMPEALGQLKYGENIGGETATQQVKTQYEPSRAGMTEQQKLEQQLSYEPRIAQEKKRSEAMAETQSDLNERLASLPQLEETVQRLRDLGEKATYTMTGRAVDVARRESGMEPREAAVARKEYISLVDNQILPLLRQTFGAQFTQKEGESLKITLGDPNASPAEKDAVLRSFIQQKMATIQTMQRQLGQDPMQASRDAIMQRNSEMPESINSYQTLPEPPQIDTYQRGEMEFNLKKQGFTQEQIDEYMKARGLK